MHIRAFLAKNSLNDFFLLWKSKEKLFAKGISWNLFFLRAILHDKNFHEDGEKLQKMLIFTKWWNCTSFDSLTMWFGLLIKSRYECWILKWRRVEKSKICAHFSFPSIFHHARKIKSFLLSRLHVKNTARDYWTFLLSIPTLTLTFCLRNFIHLFSFMFS